MIRIIAQCARLFHLPSFVCVSECVCWLPLPGEDFYFLLSYEQIVVVFSFRAELS